MPPVVTAGPPALGLKTALSRIFRLTVPLSLFHVGHSLLGMVDTAFVGRLGAAELAAVSLGNLLLFLIQVLGMGVVAGTEPLVAQSVGAGRHRRARVVTRVGLGLAVVVTPAVWLGFFGVTLALPLFGLEERVVELTGEYLAARAPGIPFALAYTAVRSYLQGYNRTRSIIVAVVACNVVNVPADMLLIFGDEALLELGLPGFGLPALGVFGAGLASSLAALIQLVVTATPAWRLGQEQAQIPDEERPIPARELVGPTVRLGVPVGLQYAAEVGAFAAVGVAMGRLSTEALAAHQLALMLGSVSFRLVLGVSSATAVVVGQQVGARDRPGTARAGLAGLLLGTAIMMISGAIFLLFPGALARAFTPERAVVLQAIDLIRIAAAFQLSDGLQAVMGGALRGGGEPAWAFGINLVAYYLIAFPVGLWLAFSAGYGGPGLWWGLCVGLTVAAAGQAARFFVKAKRGYDPT